jgi:anthranilate phosphoribosyltransferase
MIKEIIAELVEGKDLSAVQIQSAMEEIMTGSAMPSQTAAFLTALRLKGETAQEISAAAAVMRKFVTRINTTKKPVFDLVGTGGDCSDTFNISTVSAFVVAGCGITVAKHGNRSVSSKCGSADLLEALGVNINMSKEKMEKCLEKAGISFLFAPSLHPAMKYATPVRREIGIRTIFNILGPLTNPAFATHQLLGVYDEKLMEVMAIALKNLGLTHAMVVYGRDGLDEITTTDETLIFELKDGRIDSYKISPEQFGINRARSEELKGRDKQTNASIASEILDAKSGPKTDIVLLNSGCAIYTADKARDIKEGIDLARESIESGRAREKLDLLRKFSTEDD